MVQLDVDAYKCKQKHQLLQVRKDRKCKEKGRLTGEAPACPWLDTREGNPGLGGGWGRCFCLGHMLHSIHPRYESACAGGRLDVWCRLILNQTIGPSRRVGKWLARFLSGDGLFLLPSI